jgi:hypothetical protein
MAQFAKPGDFCPNEGCSAEALWEGKPLAASRLACDVTHRRHYPDRAAACFHRTVLEGRDAEGVLRDFATAGEELKPKYL